MKDIEVSDSAVSTEYVKRSTVRLTNIENIFEAQFHEPLKNEKVRVLDAKERARDAKHFDDFGGEVVAFGRLISHLQGKISPEEINRLKKTWGPFIYLPEGSYEVVEEPI